MDKKFYRKFLKKLRFINIWGLLVVAIVSAVVCVTALRNNNLKALQLRDQVLQVDKDNGDVETALRELREFIYGHMNTDLASGSNAIKPPIQLKYRYERLLKAEQERSSVENSQIYTAAQADCEKRFPVGLSGSGRIPCIEEYLTANGVTQNKIEDDLYKFDFVSPNWSPDLAGWSLIVASLSLALFVIRFGMERWLHAELRDL